MTLRLQLVRETQNARLYQFKDGQSFWVPRSVCNSTVKFPPRDPLVDPIIHEVDIEDWWWDKYERSQDPNPE